MLTPFSHMKRTPKLRIPVRQHFMTSFGYSVANMKNDRLISNYQNKFPIYFKLSKIENCKLTKVGELDFDYYLGGCNTFSFGILLCFSESDPQTCHS